MWHFTRRRVFWVMATRVGSLSINHDNASDNTGRLGAGYCESRSSRSCVQSNFCCTYTSLPTELLLTCHTARRYWRRWHVCTRTRRPTMSQGPTEMVEIRRRAVQSTRCRTMHGRRKSRKGRPIRDTCQNITDCSRKRMETQDCSCNMYARTP